VEPVSESKLLSRGEIYASFFPPLSESTVQAQLKYFGLLLLVGSDNQEIDSVISRKSELEQIIHELDQSVRSLQYELSQIENEAAKFRKQRVCLYLLEESKCFDFLLSIVLMGKKLRSNVMMLSM